jgi:hypothetical protein
MPDSGNREESGRLSGLSRRLAIRSSSPPVRNEINLPLSEKLRRHSLYSSQPVTVLQSTVLMLIEEGP